MATLRISAVLRWLAAAFIGGAILAGCGGVTTVRVMDGTLNTPVRDARISYTAEPGGAAIYVGWTGHDGELFFVVPLQIDMLLASKTGFVDARESFEELSRQARGGGIEIRLTPEDPSMPPELRQ